MYTNGHFQYALTRLYREYLTTIGPRRVKEFLAHNGRGNGDQLPSPEQIAADVDIFSSAASAKYFLRRAAAGEEIAP